MATSTITSRPESYLKHKTSIVILQLCLVLIKNPFNMAKGNYLTIFEIGLTDALYHKHFSS